MKTKITSILSLLTGVVLALGGLMPAVAQSTTTVASLYFTPATKSATFVAGGTNTFTIDLMVNTGGQPVVGVDAVITYDPAYLEFVSGNNAGSLFTVPIVMPQGTGKHLITGLLAPGSSTAVNSASAKISTLTFKTLQLGTTNLGVVGPAESNVAHQDPAQGDILGTTTGATVNITATQPPVPIDEQILTSVVISPTSAQVVVGGTRNFTATAYDQNGLLMATTGALDPAGVMFSWSVSNNLGTFSSPPAGNLPNPSTTTFTAGIALGSGVVTVTATQGGVTKTATANIAVVNQLVNNGPEDWLWAGVALAAFAMAFLAYRRMEMKPIDEVAADEPVEIDPVEKI